MMIIIIIIIKKRLLLIINFLRILAKVQILNFFSNFSLLNNLFNHCLLFLIYMFTFKKKLNLLFTHTHKQNKICIHK